MNRDTTTELFRKDKKKHPELYCYKEGCLWRVNSGFCPRHQAEARERENSGEESCTVALMRALGFPMTRETYLAITERTFGIAINLRATNDVKAITLNYRKKAVENPTPETLTTGDGLIVFYNFVYAKRFAKAFQHAVILCGGKPSTF